MAITMTRDNLQSLVGTELGVSDWFPIDQARINAFADATLDHQFIHVDPELAAKSPFGSTIAHGFLTLSLLSHLVGSIGTRMEGATMGLNYGFEKVRFLAPVRVNRRIRGRMKLLEAQEKSPGTFLMKHEVTVEIDGETKPALVAEWLTMVMTG